MDYHYELTAIMARARPRRRRIFTRPYFVLLAVAAAFSSGHLVGYDTGQDHMRARLQGPDAVTAADANRTRVFDLTTADLPEIELEYRGGESI